MSDMLAAGSVQEEAGIVGIPEARAWLERVSGLKFAHPSFRQSLKSGVLLCL